MYELFSLAPKASSEHRPGFLAFGQFRSPDWTFGLDDEGHKWNINLMFHLWPLALDLQLHFSCLLMMAWAVALVWRIDNVCDFIHETTMLLLLVNLVGRLFSLPQKKPKTHEHPLVSYLLAHLIPGCAYNEAIKIFSRYIDELPIVWMTGSLTI